MTGKTAVDAAEERVGEFGALAPCPSHAIGEQSGGHQQLGRHVRTEVADDLFALRPPLPDRRVHDGAGNFGERVKRL